MTLNGENALFCRKDASFGAHCTNLNEDRPIVSAAKMQANDSSFWKYKVYVDIRWGSSGWGHQVTLAFRRRQFLAISVATSSETSEIRPTVLYGDMLPLVGL